MSNWEVYNALIDAIPDDVMANEVIIGDELTYVECQYGGGISPYRKYSQRAPMMDGNKNGRSLKELASLIKSWNFVESSVGNAALTAWYNNLKVATENGVEIPREKSVEGRLKDPFINSQNEVKGKKVCVVGHFPFLENLFEPVCDLKIIEWDPSIGDYPYSSCEYFLPECDYAYLTCAAVGDKTLPRLLELSQNAKKITIVGPGTPLAPQFFDFGVNDLSGFIVTDNEYARRIVTGAEFQRIYAAGVKVNLLSK